MLCCTECGFGPVLWCNDAGLDRSFGAFILVGLVLLCTDADLYQFFGAVVLVGWVIWSITVGWASPLEHWCSFVIVLWCINSSLDYLLVRPVLWFTDAAWTSLLMH